MPLLLRVTAPCSVAGPVADAQPDRFGTFEILDDQGQRVPLALPLWHVSAIRGWPHNCKTRTPSVKSLHVVDFPATASALSGSAGWSSSASPQGSVSWAIEPSER